MGGFIHEECVLCENANIVDTSFHAVFDVIRKKGSFDDVFFKTQGNYIQRHLSHVHARDLQSHQGPRIPYGRQRDKDKKSRS
jgi:hypothetical protein